MSIAKLNYLLETKNQIKNAIVAKGVAIEDTDTFRSYADKINDIKGGNIEEYLILNPTLLLETSYLFNRIIKEIPNNVDISNYTNLANCFYYCVSLTEIDLTKVLLNDNVMNIMAMFWGCSNLQTINLGKISNLKLQHVGYTFYNCYKLIEIIGTIDMINNANVSNTFQNCKELKFVNIKNLNITGLDLSTCNKLSYESLMYLINNIIETTTTKTISLGSTNLAKLTDEEKAIATSKGWTLG